MVGKPACQQGFNWYYKILKWTGIVYLECIFKYLFLLNIVELKGRVAGVAFACHFGLVLVGKGRNELHYGFSVITKAEDERVLGRLAARSSGGRREGASGQAGHG